MTAMPTVLFVCVHNAGRSQMAAGFLRHLAGDRVDVRSAGSAPRAGVNPVAVKAMREVGIDIAKAVPSRVTDVDVKASDYVITMGCGDRCPVVPGVKRDDWPLEDPKGQPVERVRQIRDDVRARVRAFVNAEGLGR